MRSTLRHSTPVIASLVCLLASFSCRVQNPTSQVSSPSDSFTIELCDDGSVTRDGAKQAIDHQSFRADLEEFHKAEPSAALEILSSADATHGDLEKLLRTVAACRVERVILRDNSDQREFEFQLDLDEREATEGFVHEDRLPPMKLRLRADANGELATILLNESRMRDFAALQKMLVAIVGDSSAFRETAELEIDGDPSLRMKHVLDAMEAVTSYVAADGEKMKLVRHARPVSWDRPIVEEFEPLRFEASEEMEAPPIEMQPVDESKPIDPRPLLDRVRIE